MAALPLIILFAAYGSLDTTERVRTLVKDNTLTVAAENNVFTDPLVGTFKTLVVTYQYGANNKPVTQIVEEHQTMVITPTDANQQPWNRPTPIGLNILGAYYGMMEVTEKVQALIKNDELHFGNFDNTLGNGWSHEESLVICYQYSQDTPAGVVQDTRGYVNVVGPELKILKAVYGFADVTPTVNKLITNQNNKRLETTVSSSVFGDNWVGVSKSLVVVYQYKDFLPQVAVQKDGGSMSIGYQTGSGTYSVPASTTELQILGAAFGPLDVTDKAKARVQRNTLVVDAWSKVFGDSWPGNKKTLVVVYRYGSKDIQFAVAPDVSTVMDKYPNYVSIRA